MSAIDVARKYNIGRAAVYKIATGDTYRDVGGPLRPKRPRLAPGMTPEQVRAEGKARLLERIDVAANGCWLWNRSTDAKGYATMHLGGKDHRAHRLAYELFVGPIPAGQEIEHACHGRDVTCFAGNDCQHRRCCRPDHLVPVDHATNVRSGRSWSIHGLKTHCPRGHAYDATNTRFLPKPNGGMSRACRTCAREKRRAERARQREARENKGAIADSTARADAHVGSGLRAKGKSLSPEVVSAGDDSKDAAPVTTAGDSRSDAARTGVAPTSHAAECTADACQPSEAQT